MNEELNFQTDIAQKQMSQKSVFWQMSHEMRTLWMSIGLSELFGGYKIDEKQYDFIKINTFLNYF